MNDADDADGSLDPRIQIELENLNNATDDINKLETELDEANTAFNQLLSETTKRLTEIVDKLGYSCIEKARCYYEALEVARQAQVQCQQQAQLFQRASEIHAAAKETVALAETRFMSHQHEWNFDQAWQDMLNHATLKVMDAENQKAECGREHHRRAMLFHDAEKRLLQLEEKHRRSIIKARPYFEVKAQCDQMLATQKERVECLEMAIKESKNNYASSLRTLEEISNQIHEQRRDYDIVANGPREPGVGAELVSPDKNINYEVEFSHLNADRANSMTDSQLKKDAGGKDDNEISETKDEEHLGKRSVDGSEATSSQWELELQTSMENLNNLSFENSVYNSDQENLAAPNLHLPNKDNSTFNNAGNNDSKVPSPSFSVGRELPMSTLKQWQKFSNSFQVLTKPLTSASLTSYVDRLHLIKSDDTSSILPNKFKIALKSYVSKSLHSSPINTNAFNSERKKFNEEAEGDDTRKHVPKNIMKLGDNNQKSHSNSDINQSWNLDINAMKNCEKSNSVIDKDDTLYVETDAQLPTLSDANESCTTDKSSKNDLNNKDRLSSTQFNYNDAVPQLQDELTSQKTRPKSNPVHVTSYSASSTPVRTKGSSFFSTAKSLDNKLSDDPNRSPTLQVLTNKMSGIKELPLLSLFEKTSALADSKGRSSSMINLDDKQSLMILLGNSHLNNIQAVSVERLANARDNLFGKVPR